MQFNSFFKLLKHALQVGIQKLASGVQWRLRFDVKHMVSISRNGYITVTARSRKMKPVARDRGNIEIVHLFIY